MAGFNGWWSVPRGGFHIADLKQLQLEPDTGDMAHWVLVQNPDPPGISGRRVFFPMKEPALYANFAGIKTDDPAAVLEFANEYGTLAFPVTRQCKPGAAEGSVTGHVTFELGLRWVLATTQFRLAGEVREKVRMSKDIELEKYLRFDKSEGRWSFSNYHDWPARRGNRPVDHIYRALPRTDQPTDVRTAAAEWLRQTINDGLREGCSVQVEYDSETGRDVLRQVPQNLLGALWLQFALAHVGNRPPRMCLTCGKWFDTSPDVGRTARGVFCSDPCKSMDYRKRKGRATELAGEGKTPKQITEQLKGEMLETEIETVTKWVRSVTKKKGK